MHLLAEKKGFEDKYKDLNILPKVDKVDIAGTMEAIGVVRVPLAYTIRKAI